MSITAIASRADPDASFSPEVVAAVLLIDWISIIPAVQTIAPNVAARITSGKVKLLRRVAPVPAGVLIVVPRC